METIEATLLKDMTNIVLLTQEELKRVKEDTNTLALNMKQMINLHKQENIRAHTNIENLVKANADFSNEVESQINSKGLNSYTEFLKELVDNDFKNRLNQLGDKLKKELKGEKPKAEVKARIPFVYQVVLGICACGLACSLYFNYSLHTYIKKAEATFGWKPYLEQTKK